MTRVRMLYRSTLIAAALATASLTAASAAEAHEQGWRGHGERAWEPRPAEHWYRHGYRSGSAYGHGGYRYARDARDCEVPVARFGYYPPPVPFLPRVVVELPSPW